MRLARRGAHFGQVYALNRFLVLLLARHVGATRARQTLYPGHMLTALAPTPPGRYNADPHHRATTPTRTPWPRAGPATPPVPDQILPYALFR